MAKELPYFKFFCSEWTDGDITLEDLKTQGLFVNICSYYWSRECQVSLEILQKRFRNNTKQLQNLLKAKIIKEDDENVFINFLDKQWLEREKIKHRNQQNGKAGGRPKKTQSVSNNNPVVTNIEKRREEERREVINYLNKLTDKKFRSDKGLLARLNDGYTVEDCKRVINIKVAEWTGTEQAIYLRPETLFGNKFDGYLNQELKKTYKDFDHIESIGVYADREKQIVYDANGTVSNKYAFFDGQVSTI